MKFTLDELKRMNRLLKNEIKETTDEMKCNNSKEINEYLEELLKQWVKIREMLLTQK